MKPQKRIQEFIDGQLYERQRILKLIDEEAKNQYSDFIKETGLELKPNGWKDWNIVRRKLKNAIGEKDE